MRLRLERPIDLLSEQEFQAPFHIPDKISIHLVDGEALSSEKQPHNETYFNPSRLLPSKCCSGVDGIQRSGHALLAGSFPIGKGRAKGHVPIFGHWSGLFAGPDGVFTPQRLLQISSKDRRGYHIEWVEKAFFALLNKLFEIEVFERNHKVFLLYKNLLAFINEPKSFIMPVFPHVAPSFLVPVSSFSSSSSSSTASNELETGVDWGSLSEAYLFETCLIPTPVPAHSATVAEIILEPNEKFPSTEYIAHHEPKRPSIDLDHFSDESFDCMASCPKPSYVSSWEEVAKLLRQIPSFTKRETLVQNMGVFFSATQWSSVKIENNLDRSFTTRLSYDTLDIVISRIMSMQDYMTFETMEVVTGIRNLIRQCAQLFYRLEAGKTMMAYIAHNMDDNEDFRTRMTEEEKEATQAEARWLAEEKEAIMAGNNKTDEEARRLRQELRAGFAIQKEELETDYQKQVDNMFFYSYRCCMKKHDVS
ncbi:hypothetical protein AAG906_008725 [Vitis piasezkii]